MTNSRKCSLLDKLVFESVDSIDFGEAAMGNGISDEMGKDSTSASDTLDDSDISLCLPYLCYLSQRLCAEQRSSSSEILNCSAEKVPWSFLEPLGNAGALKRFVQSIVESRQIFSYLSLDIKILVKSVRETLSQMSESLSSNQVEFTAKNSESNRHPFEEGTDAERIMLIAADLISASPISNSSALGSNEYVDEAGIITALIYLSCPSVAPIRQLFSRLSLLPTFEIIAMTLIYNLPERFFEICSVLVAGFCEGNQKYKEIVFSLIPRGELISRQIREEAEKYPLSTNVMTLILATTLESIKDTVHYFYGRVRNDAPFLRSLSMIGGLTLICDTLVERLGEREDLYCGLALLCCLRTVEKGLNERETGVIVDISNDPASSQEIHKMILFYFLIFPEAINLISKKGDVVHSIVSHCPPEILLQVVSSLRVNSMRTIETVISGLLGLPVNLNISSSFGTFRDALTREFISPTFCDDFLHPLPIVMRLNHFSVTQIPKCVSAIIISGIAKERNVDISDYIWKQAMQCTKPVRSDFVEAIRLYAKQLNSLGTATFARISQGNIIALFNGKLDQLCACPMTAKLLILEYVLWWNSDCFQDNVLQLLQNTLFFSCIREKVLDYNKCKSKESEYITTAFTSQLMGQLVSRCPQLFEPEHELDLAFLRQEKIIWRTLPRSFTAEELGNPRFVGRCFTHVAEQPERVYLVLLSIKPNKDTLPFISALFPLIIGNVVIEEQWLKVWKEAFESWTAYVAEMTLIALSVWTARQHNLTPDEFLTQATTTMSKPSSSIVSDAYADPLTILRLDKCFLGNVRGIDIILELLSYFLTASRKKIFAQIKAQPNEEQELNNIICYQDTIALQILIEWTLLVENEIDDLSTVIQIRRKIFTFLHSTFCKNISLLQKVHQQGYPIAAIPLLVKGVPSFHLCSTFLREMLLNQVSDYQSLLFAFYLTADIVKEYPIKSNLDISKTAAERFNSVIMCTEQTYVEIDREKSLSRIEFIIKVLPAIVKIGKAFKLTAIDLLQILTKLIALISKNRHEEDPLQNELYDASTNALHEIVEIVSEL